MRLRRLDAYLIDVAIALGALALANVLFVPDDPGFFALQPHPALIVAAALGARRGLREGAIVGVVFGVALLATWALRQEIIPDGMWSRLSTYTTPLLVCGAGVLFGAIGEARRRETQRLRDRLVNLQLELADQAVRFAATTETSRELERRVADETASLSTLHAAARALDTLDVERLHTAIVSVAHRFVAADACQLYLTAGGMLTLRDSIGELPPRTTLPLDDGVVGLAIRHGRAVSVRDYIAVAAVEDLKQAPVLLAAPLVVDGVLFGCLTVTRLPFTRLTPTTVDRLGVAAEWAARALANARAYEASREEAMTDATVGANSYAYYQRRLAEEQTRADRYDRPLSLVVFTVERLDRVLPRNWPELGRLLGIIFKRSLRDADLVCRYATDGSFAVILPETAVDGAETIGKRLLGQIRDFHFKPYDDEQAELELGMRVVEVRGRGIARRPPVKRAARPRRPTAPRRRAS